MTPQTLLDSLKDLQPDKIDLSLERLKRLLKALDHPERAIAPVYHIAGTNGKGSTLTFLRAMLEGAGKRVHSYTSPHLVHFNERIRLAIAPGISADVDDEALQHALDICKAANGDEPITFFEMTTAMAFWLFAKKRADLCLIEVGLGGRLDATNVIDQPKASLITPISLDHKEWLGPTLEKIAREKAGIIKKHCPVIIGPQNPEVLEILKDIAESLSAPVYAYGEAWTVHEESGRMVYQDEQGLLDLPLPAMAGRHQVHNAATALATLRATYASITPEAIHHGLTQAFWPARMQSLDHLAQHYIGDDSEIWLDGGHNAAGAEAISETLADLEERHSRPLIVIIGLMARKDVQSFLAPFQGLVAELIAVPIKGHDNCHDPEALALEARAMGFYARTASSLKAALAEVGQNDDNPRVLITGSLYLAGEALQLEAPKLV
jgi:dihydrofolate synthase/folylpolyglutamate synthase